MERSAIIFVFCVLGVIALASAEGSINYGVLNTILKSPLRREFSKSVSDEQKTTESTNAEFLNYNVTSQLPTKLDDVSFDDKPREISSASDDGLSKMAEIYRDCTTKVDKRVESLLSWKFSKSNTAKDLIELKQYVTLLYKCLKVQSLRYFDGVINEDVIPLTSYVELVNDQQRSYSDSNILHLGKKSINGKLYYPGSNQVNPKYVSEIIENDWSTLLLDRLSRLLETHSMKFRLDENAIQGRGRRRDHKMFAMMVMGFMIMATILIPMGFQFLTVLGGKSLLMAKMALIMSAINGLKKIATSQVGYGFYHTGPDAHHDHHHGFHDKIFKVGVKREPEFL